MILSHVDCPASCLPQRAHPELEMIVTPEFLLNGKNMTEIRARAGETGLQAGERFVFAKTMRDGKR
jgi:hypothetical protein